MTLCADEHEIIRLRLNFTLWPSESAQMSRQDPKWLSVCQTGLRTCPSCATAGISWWEWKITGGVWPRKVCGWYMQDTWPDTSGDFRNMHTHIHRRVWDKNMLVHTNIGEGKWGEQLATRQTSGWRRDSLWCLVGGRIQWEVFGLHWFTLWVVLRCMGVPRGGYSWQQGRRKAIRIYVNILGTLIMDLKSFVVVVATRVSNTIQCYL